MYHYLESGLNRIYLANGYRLEMDEEFGELLIVEDADNLNRAIALDLIGQRQRINGAEFKFLRTHLDLTQKKLAELLATNEQSIAKFEKARNKPVGNRPLERLFRAIALERLAPAKVRQFLRHLRSVADADASHVIKMQHDGHHWREIRAAA